MEDVGRGAADGRHFHIAQPLGRRPARRVRPRCPPYDAPGPGPARQGDLGWSRARPAIRKGTVFRIPGPPTAKPQEPWAKKPVFRGVFRTPEQHENILGAMRLGFSDHRLKESWPKDLRHPLMAAPGYEHRFLTRFNKIRFRASPRRSVSKFFGSLDFPFGFFLDEPGRVCGDTKIFGKRRITWGDPQGSKCVRAGGGPRALLAPTSTFRRDTGTSGTGPSPGKTHGGNRFTVFRLFLHVLLALRLLMAQWLEHKTSKLLTSIDNNLSTP